MRHSKSTEVRMTLALRQAERGTPVTERCRRLEITETTFYHCKRNLGGPGRQRPPGADVLKDGDDIRGPEARAHHEREALPRVPVDERQHPQAPPVGEPVDKCLIGAFNSSLWRECLSQHGFALPAEAEQIRRRAL